MLNSWTVRVTMISQLFEINEWKGAVSIARAKRIWYPGANYHIMSRGNGKQKIFHDRSDYELFLRIVKDVQKQHPFIIHAYCLMSNHFHLQVETLETEIWIIMKKILFLYTMNYNTKYSVVGHLFQGRYKALLIEDDAYFLETNRYIHLNPVKAGLVENPSDYLYSSYSSYISGKENSILTKNKITDYFQQFGKYSYQHFVEDVSSHVENEQRIRSGLNENELWEPD